jgi:hypothetical protein
MIQRFSGADIKNLKRAIEENLNEAGIHFVEVTWIGV